MRQIQPRNNDSSRNYKEKKERDPRAIWLALDEAALLSIPTLTRMWALKGIQPIIPMHFGKKERKTLFGAVNLKTGNLVGQVVDMGNAQTFQEFLDCIRARYQRGHLAIILDNVRFHHAKVIAAYLKHYPRISFLFLPPYYPNLNPQEMVWQIMRRSVTHCMYYQTFTHEVAAARRFFKNTCIEIKNNPTSLIVRR